MEEIFQIISCADILSNDIKIYTTDMTCSTVNKQLQGHVLGDLHPLTGKSVLNTYDRLFSYKSTADKLHHHNANCSYSVM